METASGNDAVEGAARARGRPRGDARERILDAASRLLAERGAAASTEDIAREAGVARRTVFNYFPAREDLVADCLEPLIGDGIAIADRLLAAGRGGAGALGELCAELLGRHPDRAGLLGAVDFSGSARLAELHGRYLSRFRELAGAGLDLPALRAVYRCFAPLAAAVGSEPDGPARFGAAIRGLAAGMLEGAGPSGGGDGRPPPGGGPGSGTGARG